MVAIAAVDDRATFVWQFTAICDRRSKLNCQQETGIDVVFPTDVNVVRFPVFRCRYVRCFLNRCR